MTPLHTNTVINAVNVAHNIVILTYYIIKSINTILVKRKTNEWSNAGVPQTINDHCEVGLYIMYWLFYIL